MRVKWRKHFHGWVLGEMSGLVHHCTWWLPGVNCGVLGHGSVVLVLVAGVHGVVVSGIRGL